MSSPFFDPLGEQVRDSGADAGAALVARIRAGDQSAVEEVFRATYAALVVHAARVAGSRVLAEDIVQEVFCSLWDRRAELEVRESLTHYLHRAVRYRALNVRRRESVEERHRESVRREDDDPHVDGEAIVAEREQAEAIAKAVAALPTRTRQVFMLSRRGLTYAEIAGRMRISVKTVEGQMARSFRSLRKSLGALLG